MRKQNTQKLVSFMMIITMIFSLLTPFSTKADTVLTVAEAIANNTGTATVEGYIVGTTNSGPSYNTTGPFDGQATNIAIADSPTETDKGKIMPVQLPSGSIRTALNLADNPNNLGGKVQISGTLTAYFGAPGLKSPTSYQWIEDLPVDETKVQQVISSAQSGLVREGTEVTLSTSTPEAKIYYTVDGSEPTTASQEHSAPIVINQDTTIKAVGVVDGLENSDVATFEYKILSEKSIAEARVLPTGTLTEISGTVTAIFTAGLNNVYIQDETAGIIVRGSALDSKVAIGDKIHAIGEMSDYYGMQQLLVSASDVTVTTPNAGVPTPQLVTSADLNEPVEGKLVTIHNVTIGAKDSNGNFSATDSVGNLVLKPGDASFLTSGKTYDSITGVVNYDFNEYKIVPRTAGDVIEDASVVASVTANPTPGMVPPDTTVVLSSLTEGATIYYTTNGDAPTVDSDVYTTPIAIIGDMTIKAFAVKEDLTDSEVSEFTYTVGKDLASLRIHDIQGAAHTSPYLDQNVSNVEGVVTYVLDSNNFYMQDLQPDNDPNTSEAVLVYKRTHGLTVGDVANVSGQVKEYHIEGYAEKAETDLPVTEISASTVEKVRSNESLPAPIKIGVDRIPPTEIIDNDNFANFDPEEDGIDFYESLEGMLVSVENAKVVAPQKYGEVVVIPGTLDANTTKGNLRISEDDFNPERITIDFNDTGFVTKAGDRFDGTITGVVSYGFSNYRVLTKKDALPALIEGNNEREVTTLVKDDNKLTIASYNVENFSSNTSDEKVTKLAQAVVTNMKNPDIVGLVEVQDNDGETNNGNTSADLSAKKLIDKIKALGGPTYVYTDIAPVNNQDGGAPGGNIRVGFIYNPDRVSLATGMAKGTATQSVGFENGKLTVNPGRIDPTNEAFNSSRKPLAAQFEFKGESIIVVANHFNSKGGDQPLFGKNQPPVLGSEAQRMKIANIVNGFVQDVKAKDPNANIVLLGDLNDYEFSNPIVALKGNELVNMIEKVPANERFTYVYQGNSQVLDHILVSNNLEQHTDVDILHINSSFMEEHGRASDHDPVMIQVDLGVTDTPVTLEKIDITKTYKLKGFNTKKLTIKVNGADVEVFNTTTISEGITLKGNAILKGEGLKNTTIILDPENPNAVYDFSGVEVKEVIIKNGSINQIQGAENIQTLTVEDGVDASGIQFFNSAGESIDSLVVLPPRDDDKEDETPPPALPLELYYQSAAGLSGDRLKAELHEIIDDHHEVTYSTVWEALRETDEDPNNPNNVILLYTGRSQSKTSNGGGVDNWNREHVWAKSHGDFGTSMGAGTDLHHLRPTDVTVNSARGNKDFDNGGQAHSECTACKTDSDSWEPPNNVKGDVARMLFYMAVRYEGDSGELDLELADRVSTYPQPLHGKLSVLLEWHEQDPVDAFERNRNNIIQKWQGNRNPFIDHPEWVAEIW